MEVEKVLDNGEQAQIKLEEDFWHSDTVREEHKIRQLQLQFQGRAALGIKGEQGESTKYFSAQVLEQRILIFQVL